MPTPQAPIGSGFDASSTAADINRGVDLGGKIAIVTGGYSGHGREAVRASRAAGARVIVPARDVDRAAKALTGIDVEIEPMELLDPVLIDAFAGRCLASGEPLHIHFNSAGIMAAPCESSTALSAWMVGKTSYFLHAARAGSWRIRE
jgi:NAD(P)-dependent dehydrogenase (short-subunit alcohol dehydrogenase family)